MTNTEVRKTQVWKRAGRTDDGELIEDRDSNQVAIVLDNHSRFLENSALIAAAPELLQACKNALEWINPDIPDSRSIVCDQLSRAIRRATDKGEQLPPPPPLANGQG